MKTLILNGSPKKNGDTTALVNALASHLQGEVRIVTTESDISPCVDCRYCWENVGCALQDEMQEIYSYLDDCDNVVFASPIWFATLSGPLLNMTSRIQTVFAASYFQKIPIPFKEKRGAIILVGGQPETKDAPTQTAVSIMRYFNVHRPSVMKIYSLNTDKLPAAQDTVAIDRCREVAEILNQCQSK